MAMMLTLLLTDPVSELIACLGDDDCWERERATQALMKLGKRVEPRLKAFHPKDTEVAWRRTIILNHLASRHTGPEPGNRLHRL